MGLRKYFKNQIGVLRENSSGLEGGGESVLKSRAIMILIDLVANKKKT